jgi:hypothetical protein
MRRERRQEEREETGRERREVRKIEEVKSDWYSLAECRGQGHWPFFAPDGDYDEREMGEARRIRHAEARKVCEGCLARKECLADALSQPGDIDGVWGGTTRAQRRTIKRKRGRGRRTA